MARVLPPTRSEPRRVERGTGYDTLVENNQGRRRGFQKKPWVKSCMFLIQIIFLLYLVTFFSHLTHSSVILGSEFIKIRKLKYLRHLHAR